MPEAETSRCCDILGAIAQIASGYIHEINNKLGPILLDAEVIAMTKRGTPEAAADIARNAMVLRDMVRDLEIVLTNNYDLALSATDRVRLAERLARGSMRQRHLRMDTSGLEILPTVTKKPGEVMAALLLATLAFRGPEEGEPGVVRVRCSERDNLRTWLFEVEPVSLPSAGVFGMLSEVCGRNGWQLRSGEGSVAIVLSKDGTDARG